MEHSESKQAHHPHQKHRTKIRASWFAAIAVIWTVMSAAIGYVAKAALDVQQKGDELRDERKLTLEADQLREFWWPLYFRLQVDSAIWKPIASTHQDERLTILTPDLVDDLLLPNHDEAVNIIRTKYYLAAGDASPQLQKWFVEYIDHVATYHAIRKAAKTDKTLESYTPENRGKPFPGKPASKDECPKTDPDCNLFVNAVGEMAKKLQARYDQDTKAVFEHRSLR
jgi:hypothetical protein